MILPFVQAAISQDKMLQNKYIVAIAPILGISNAEKLLLLMGIALILIYIIKNVFLIYASYVQYEFMLINIQNNNAENLACC